jgi:hypothetical protein
LNIKRFTLSLNYTLPLGHFKIDEYLEIRKNTYAIGEKEDSI